MDWRCGSSSRAPALKAWSPEFKPSPKKKKNKPPFNVVFPTIRFIKINTHRMTAFNSKQSPASLNSSQDSLTRTQNFLGGLLGIAHTEQALYHWATSDSKTYFAAPSHWHPCGFLWCVFSFMSTSNKHNCLTTDVFLVVFSESTLQFCLLEMGVQYVAQASLELAILQPQLLECWVCRWVPSCPV
jgi:hypothetical protein